MKIRRGYLVLFVGGFIACGWLSAVQADNKGEQTTTPSVSTTTEKENPPSSSTATESPTPTQPNINASAETTPQAPQAEAVQAETPPPSESVPIVPTPNGLISIDFKDADILQVLRIISLKSGVDIVAGKDVEGLVTIKLTNVPWEQALEIILRTYGFSYEKKDNIVRVMTVDALAKEALSTEVFPLDYAKAKEVPDVIKEMLSDRGKVKFDERTNTLIVTDIPASLFKVKEVIARIDQRTPQVLIEAKVIETKLSKTENLGIDWSGSLKLAATDTSLPTSFPFPTRSNFGNLGQSFIPRASGSTDARVPDVGGTVTFGKLSSGAFSATLNFLQSRTDTSIVSNPSIAALNNQEAKVHIGSEFPIPNYTIDPTTGKTTISGYTSKNVGTILTVTPHVNPSSEIVVDVKPEVIAVADKVTYDTGGGSSVSLPQFTTQTAQTQVRIRSGDTIAIGGLIKTTDAKKQTKVPILGDIPIIGWLFTNTSRNDPTLTSDPIRQDLLIFLTVKMIEEHPASSQTVAAVPAEPPIQQK